MQDAKGGDSGHWCRGWYQVKTVYVEHCHAPICPHPYPCLKFFQGLECHHLEPPFLVALPISSKSMGGTGKQAHSCSAPLSTGATFIDAAVGQGCAFQLSFSSHAAGAGGRGHGECCWDMLGQPQAAQHVEKPAFASFHRAEALQHPSKEYTAPQLRMTAQICIPMCKSECSCAMFVSVAQADLESELLECIEMQV